MNSQSGHFCRDAEYDIQSRFRNLHWSFLFPPQHTRENIWDFPNTKRWRHGVCRHFRGNCFVSTLLQEGTEIIKLHSFVQTLSILFQHWKDIYLICCSSLCLATTNWDHYKIQKCSSTFPLSWFDIPSPDNIIIKFSFSSNLSSQSFQSEV